MKIVNFVFLSRLSLTVFFVMPTLAIAPPFASTALADVSRSTTVPSETPIEDIDPEALFPQSVYFLEQAIAAKQSEEKWRLVLQQAPKNAEAYQKVADALVNLARFEEAETFYQSAIEIAPTNESPYLAYGEFLLSQGRTSSATALYQNMTEAMPDSAIAHLKLALTLDNIYTRKPFPEAAQAEAAYREALRLDPNEVSASQMLGEHLRRSGRLAEAKEIFKIALRLEPENALIYEGMAKIAEERGDLATAEAVYKQAIAANPRNLETHRRFSKWLFKHNRPSTAAQASYQAALEQFPEDEGLYDQFALYLIYDGQIDEAIALLNEAIERGIEAPFVYLYLGSAFSEKGQPAKAEAAFREAVLLSPEAYYELVAFLATSGRIKDAISVGQEAIANGVQDEFLYYKLGQLYLENEQIEEAINTYREIFRVQRSADSAISLANVLLEQGHYVEAEAIYRQFIRSYDSNSRTVQRWKRALVALDREEEASGLEQYLNARLAANWTATYQEAVRISPESGYYHYLLGESLAKQGQLSAAEAAYRDALQLGHSEFQTTIRIGKTLFDRGLTAEAEAAYTSAFALEPEPDDRFAAYALSELYQNMGELRQAQGDLYSALDFYSRAKRIDPYTRGITEKVRELESLLRD